MQASGASQFVVVSSLVYAMELFFSQGDFTFCGLYMLDLALSSSVLGQLQQLLSFV